MDKFEGVTNLVEHPIQMKPPGELPLLVLMCHSFSVCDCQIRLLLASESILPRV